MNRNLPNRFGVIDLGSNSVRVLVVDVLHPDRWKVVVEDRELIRLGQGLPANAGLAPEACRRAIDAVVCFARIAQACGVPKPAIFATAALRDAAVGPAFARTLARATGLPVRILSDREEGLAARAGIARHWNLRENHRVIADLGGGSLEVVRSFNDLILSNDSLPLGALRLTAQFGGPVHAAGKRYASLKAFVRKTLLPLRDRMHSSPVQLVGSGGGFTVGPATAGHSARPMNARELSSLIARLRSVPLEARTQFTGLARERAEILVPALTVVRELMRTLRVSEFCAHEGALREGLIQIVSRNLPANPPSCVDVARGLLHHMPDQRTHAEHVRLLASQLLQSLRSEDAEFARRLSDHHRDLLEAGALTHDLGIAVHEPTHHIESEAIVRHTPADWSQPDRNIIALLCRFHRKQPPDIDAPPLAELPRADRRPALLLIALLRVADALDRTHESRISAARLERLSRAQWRLNLRSRGSVHLELKAWWRKGGMLRDLLGGSISTVVA